MLWLHHVAFILLLQQSSLFSSALTYLDQSFLPKEPILLKNQTTAKFIGGFQNVRNLQRQCNSGINQTSVKSVFINILGNPNLMKSSDVNIIANAFVDVYNDLSLYEGCDDSNSLRIAKFSSVGNQVYANLGTRLFSQKYTFEIICSNCNPSLPMFRYPHLLDLPNDLCPCTAPQIQPFENDFIEETSRLFSSLKISYLKEISTVSDVVEVSPCPSYDVFSTSNLWMDIDGICVEDEKVSNFQALAVLFKETYNGLNLNNAETCDAYFRKIDSAVVSHLECLDDFIQLQLNVTARCRGCKLNDFTTPTLFDFYFDSISDSENEESMNIPSLERQLQHISSPESCSFGSQHPNLFTRKSSLRLIESDCICSLDPEYRTVITEEIVVGMQSNNFGKIVLAVREEEKKECNPVVTEFETTLDFYVNDATQDSDVILEAFSNTLVLSYNKLASQYCDPLFRSLKSFKIIETDNGGQQRDRSLVVNPPKKKFTGIGKGSCRNCEKKSNILTVRLYLSCSSVQPATSNSHRVFLLAQWHQTQAYSWIASTFANKEITS
jgi:hypothetical protein